MYLSKLLADRTKNVPADAKMKNHILLVRAGYIKQMAGGIYTLSMLGQKMSLNIENIIREEMDSLGAQEVKFPVVMPKELWEMTGRYGAIDGELLKFDDRKGRGFVLGMTHEEASVHLAKNWVKSYTQLPFSIYQIQTKFRDELRARGGLIRVREFTMKDAYSFHETQESLNDTYEKYFKAYERIYKRIGLGDSVIAVKSDNGVFGGDVSHEFMYMNKDGEDEIVLCESCGYCANQEVAEFVLENKKEDSLPLEEVETIDKKTIEDVCNYLGVSPKKSIKAVVFAVKGEDNAYVVCFTRGDREINETKLRKILGKETFPFDASGVKELCAGFIGPKGLNAPNAKVFYDKTLENLSNAVCGANKTNYHYKNFNFDRDMEKVEFVDISKARNGDACPLCHNKLKVSGGIEVGNIFQLGTKYTKTMDMTVLDKNGVAFNPIMGCYGIGVGRNLACIVEENSDERGICLPMSVAPFKVHISPIKYEEESVKEQTNKLYSALKAKNIPVLLDDRIVSPGIKFADADLIGMPIRVVISPRTLENGEAEIKMRKSGEIIMCNIDDALSKIEEIIKNEMLSY